MLKAKANNSWRIFYGGALKSGKSENSEARLLMEKE
jgi:hypothetical protein